MILYTTTTCTRCPIIKKKLDEAGIEYTIDQNVEEMVKLGIRSVPVLEVGGKLLTWFEIEEFINKNKGDNTCSQTTL